MPHSHQQRPLSDDRLCARLPRRRDLGLWQVVILAHRLARGVELRDHVAADVMHRHDCAVGGARVRDHARNQLLKLNVAITLDPYPTTIISKYRLPSASPKINVACLRLSVS